MSSQASLNREGWLTEVAKRLEAAFKGFRISPYRITCGWPSQQALSRTRRRVGECHSLKSSKAGVFELFISPTLDDPLEVGGTVAHEMAHVVAGTEAGHGGGFIKVARHIGLTRGRPTSAMPGDILNQRIQKIVEVVGPYPHTKMVPAMHVRESKSTAVKLECPECGVRFVMSMKWFAISGMPTCGCGTQMGLRED